MATDPEWLRRRFTDRLVRHAHQLHTDNYAPARYGAGGETRIDVGKLAFWQAHIHANMADIAWLWDALEDDASRDVLLESMAYNSLGHLKVKRTTHTPEYARALRGGPSCGGNANVARENAAHAGAVPLHLYRLDPGQITLLASEGFVLTHLINRHYLFERGAVRVSIDPGDIVLDCGACRGDTALWFAAQVGENGQIHSFEFAEENLSWFEQNLAMNPALATRVRVFRSALSDKSGGIVRYDPGGPGTRVGTEGQLEAPTLSIDDHVSQESLPRVDYIKLDVEGSESAVLSGAAHTIRTHRPKLGVSVYHRPGDWWTLARQVRDLVPGYRLYMSHHTIYDEETVLYAAPPVDGFESEA